MRVKMYYSARKGKNKRNTKGKLASAKLRQIKKRNKRLKRKIRK